MIALLLALSLSPLPGAAPVAAAEPALTPSPSVAAQSASEAELDQLHALFERSCGQRAYGSFDQVCEALGDQIKAVQREADRAKRAGPPAGKTSGS